ncbi:hypothetical protein AYO50_02565 [Acidobacteria bacterium SCGC AG-212-P17]|nr:hypothetical protein AYO50_02565 [Acidobacteria bacterium SCGC AG-212-P17]
MFKTTERLGSKMTVALLPLPPALMPTPGKICQYFLRAMQRAHPVFASAIGIWIGRRRFRLNPNFSELFCNSGFKKILRIDFMIGTGGIELCSQLFNESGILGAVEHRSCRR